MSPSSDAVGAHYGINQDLEAYFGSSCATGYYYQFPWEN